MHGFIITELSKNDEIELNNIFTKMQSVINLINVWDEVFKNKRECCTILNCFNCNLKILKYAYNIDAPKYSYYIIEKDNFDLINNFYEKYNKFTCNEYIIKNIIE